MLQPTTPLRTGLLVSPVLAALALGNSTIKDELHATLPTLIAGGLLDSPLACTIDPVATPCVQGTVDCGAFHCNANHATATYHFHLEEEVCGWEITSCSGFATDTWLILQRGGGFEVEGADDPDVCPLACSEYDPDVIGTELSGVECLPAGNYALHVLVWEAWNADCEVIDEDLPFEVCFTLGDDGGSVEAAERPAAPTLVDAWPNPFNPSTTLRWTQPETGPARLSVHDLAGAQVAVLVDGMVAAGGQSLVFDGSGLASGVYLVRLGTAGLASATRIVLVK